MTPTTRREQAALAGWLAGAFAGYGARLEEGPVPERCARDPLEAFCYRSGRRKGRLYRRDKVRTGEWGFYGGVWGPHPGADEGGVGVPSPKDEGWVYGREEGVRAS